MGNELTITLKINSQGEAVIKQVTGDFEKVGQAGQKALGGVAQNASQAKGQLDGVLTSLDSQVARWVSIAGASYLAYKAYSSWFSLISGGIATVDDYQKKIISTSYIIATMSEVPATDLSKTYGQWKEYFAWLYQQSLYADKQAAASAQDIFGVSVELAKKGVVAASEEEILTISRLTDLMKAVTPGYMNFEQQARGEIMSMMEGTARMGAQTAQILSQIDPEFKKNIASAREQGTVLQYIESILPQIKQYTLDLMGTWDAVGASLKSAWSVVNLKAFGDAHREVVDLAAQLGNRLVDNGKLTADGEKLALALGQAWATAKGSVADLLDYILTNGPLCVQHVQNIASAVGSIAGASISAVKGISNIIQELQRASENPLIGLLMGAAGGSRLGTWGAIAGGAAGFVAAGQRGNEAEVARGLEQAKKQFEGYETPMSEQVRGYISLQNQATGAPPTPPVRPFTGKEPKAKGAGRDTTETMEALILQLRQEQGKLTEGAFAEIDGWYAKIAQKIQRLAMDDRQLKEGMAVATDLKVAKERAAEENFQNWLDKANGDTTAKIIDDGIKALDKWGNTEARRKEISDSINKQLLEDHQKLEVARGQETLKYYNALASSSPLFADQYAWKEKSLALEIKLSQSEQERWFVGKGLSDTEKDSYRQLLALSNQVKAYNQERQKSVDLGTLEGWAIERVGEALKRERASIKDMLTGMESFGSDTLGQASQGVLSQDKKAAKDIGKTIVQSMVLEMQKKSFTSVWDNAAKLLASKIPSTQSVTGTGVAGNVIAQQQALQLWTQAGQGSVEAAKQLNVAAGAHVDAAGQTKGSAEMSALSAGQLGLSAAGLIASGIGILTGSKEMLLVGTVLETAASLLTMAATISMAKWWHAGGIVAHQGMIIAHAGLAYDERPAILQAGEWVLRRSAAANLATYGADTFNMLNSGRLPVLASRRDMGGAPGSWFDGLNQENFGIMPPPRRGGRPGRFSDGGSERGSDTITHDNRQVHLSVGDIHMHVPNSKMTTQEVDNLVRKQFLPAINKQLKRFGFSIGG
ncbi:MAG: hypothetical protein ACYC6G_19925 [Desulfobaccales bacterium]